MFYAYQKKLVCTLEKTGVHTRFFWCAYFETFTLLAGKQLHTEFPSFNQFAVRDAISFNSFAS